MKTYYNITKKIWGLLLLVLCFSCQDVVTYDEHIIDEFASTGAPTIESIHSMKDQVNPITSGDLEQIILIKGTNLSNVTEILFNDIPVNLRSIYATAKQAYVPIPRDIPSQVTNKLKYTTRLGSVSTDFVVDIPSLVIDRLYNEFALPGESAQIIGKYFDLYGFGTDEVTIELNGVPLKVTEVTATQVTVTLPPLADDNTYLTIKSSKFATVNLPYRMTNNVIISYDNPSNFWAGAEYITDGTAADDPEPLNGPFFRVNTSLGAWSWNNTPSGGFDLDAEIAANPSDYYLKFEVNNNTSTPFYNTSNGGGYIIKINEGDYRWNPSKDITFNTYGNWCTVTLDLAEVATEGLKQGHIGFYIAIQPNSDWTIDHSFANIRIVKKQ